MRHVVVHSLNLDAVTNSPVVLLKSAESCEDRMLPIWIGHSEAMAIILKLEGIESPRPLTHDLLRQTLEAFGYILERVEITRVESGTFFAALFLRGEERRLALDARPSDSIALALRTGSPIYVADDVWESATIKPPPAVDEEEEVARFRDFLERTDPSDFDKS